MHLAVRQACADLNRRMQRPWVWAFALGFPVVCILVMVSFAPKEGLTRVREVSWCVLTFIPMLLLSPLPWQLRGDPRRLNAWYWALPGHLLLSALLGPVLTALVVLAIVPPEGFRARFLANAGSGSLVFWGLTLPLGWMQAHAAWLKERTERARAKAEAAAWMSHSHSFDPDLLVSHLQGLAATVETEPEAAVEGILALAGLYRQWLSMSECPLVSLEEERRLVLDFLAAEGHRRGSPLEVEWDWAPGRVAWRLPPFTLFALISLMVSAGAARLRLQAWPATGGLNLSLQGALPGHLDDHATWLGVQARLLHALGPGCTLVVTPGATIQLTLPGIQQ